MSCLWLVVGTDESSIPLTSRIIENADEWKPLYEKIVIGGNFRIWLEFFLFMDLFLEKAI